MENDPAAYYRTRFNYEINQVRLLEHMYAREKAEAGLGPLRDYQTRADLRLAWKHTHRAKGLRGDIAEAHRNAQTFALAVLVERESR